MTNRSAPARQNGLAHSNAVEWAVRLLTLGASVALMVLLAVTFAGVVMRYFFNAPILGNNEIVQTTIIVLVMLAMPGAAQREMHIRVDVLDEAIGRGGRLVGDILTRLVSMIVLAILAWRSWFKAADAAEFGDATNMLQMPLWPFHALLVVGTVLYMIVLALQLIDILRSGVPAGE